MATTASQSSDVAMDVTELTSKRDPSRPTPLTIAPTPSATTSAPLEIAMEVSPPTVATPTGKDGDSQPQDAEKTPPNSENPPSPGPMDLVRAKLSPFQAQLDALDRERPGTKHDLLMAILRTSAKLSLARGSPADNLSSTYSPLSGRSRASSDASALMDDKEENNTLPPNQRVITNDPRTTTPEGPKLKSLPKVVDSRACLVEIVRAPPTFTLPVSIPLEKLSDLMLAAIRKTPPRAASSGTESDVLQVDLSEEDQKLGTSLESLPKIPTPVSGAKRAQKLLAPMTPRLRPISAVRPSRSYPKLVREQVEELQPPSTRTRSRTAAPATQTSGAFERVQAQVRLTRLQGTTPPTEIAVAGMRNSQPITPMASAPARERPQEVIQADSVSQRTTPATETSSTPPSKGAIPKTCTSASSTPRREPGVIIIENDPEEVENPAEDPLPWWATEEENHGDSALPTEEVRPMPVRQDNLPIRTDWDFEPCCYNCDSPNHRLQQCPERRITVCFSCGLKGATSKTSPHCGDKWRAAGPYVPSFGRNVPRHELQAQAPRQDTDAATPPAKNRGRRRKNPPAAKPPRPAKTSRTGRGGPPPSPPPRREESWDYYTPSYDQRQESSTPH
ncbi:uncharacterized protein DKFZp434B061-like [Diachasma alloeum]|uniref:uncharacterized protein DKFZp434B061-like n=1 Tax=Diachasma alloeum TaxID=454923 RepID=UPI0007381C01|nr:uncharacterized protein DKFZp434B061-like [Diachasma alloeum]